MVVTYKIIKCPKCQSKRLSKGGSYKSIPQATTFHCALCKHKFVVEFPNGDAPQQRVPKLLPFTCENPTVYSSVKEYMDRNTGDMK